MSDDEWEAICTTMEECFAGDFPDRKRKSYRILLRGYTAVQMLDAIATLVAKGHRFLPTPGEIVPEINAVIDMPIPGWGEVWEKLEQAMTIGTRMKGSPEVKQQAAVSWLENHTHPVVARFYEVKRHERLVMIPFYDPDYGALRIKELEREWDGFIDVARERLRRGRVQEMLGQRKEKGLLRIDTVALSEKFRPTNLPELEAGS